MSVSKTRVAFVLVFLGLLTVSCGLNPQNGSKDSGKGTDGGIFQVEDSGTPLVPVSNAIFVSSNRGYMYNSGTTTNDPVDTISNALSKVDPDGTIYVAGGEYEGAVVLNKNGVKIVGCCANYFNFQSMTQYPTTIWAGSSSGITVQNAGNVGLDSLIIRGGNASLGGSLYIVDVTNGLFTNLLLTNGQNPIYVSKGIGNSISATIVTCGGYSFGGAQLVDGLSNILNVAISGSGAYGTGALSIYYCTNTIINGSITRGGSTTASIIDLYGGLSNTVNADVTSNNSRGIDLRYEKVAVINGKVLSNNCGTNRGGGIVIDSCTNLTVNGDVGYNLSSSDGGGIYVFGSTNVVLSSTSKIYCNAAGNGGGLNVTNTIGLDAEGLISNNSASAYGTAVYSANNQDMMFNGLINAHTVTFSGSGTVYSLNDARVKVGGHLTRNGSSSFANLTAFTLSNTSSAIFNGAIFDNNGSYAPNCIYGLYTTNITIINSKFTNNNTGNGYMVYLVNSSANTSLVISNNTFGYGNTALAVSQPTSVNKFVLTYNHFIYGTLGTLYYNPSISPQVTDANWGVLNVAGSIYATEAHDNTDN